MEKKDTFSKILAVLGTILAWSPVLAPVVLGFFPLVTDGVYRFDYLMPVELGMVAFAGGALLIWGAMRARLRRRIMFWAFGLAAGSVVILLAIGDVVPGGLEWAFAMFLLVAYSLAIVVMGIGGILLWKDLFRI